MSAVSRAMCSARPLLITSSEVRRTFFSNMHPQTLLGLNSAPSYVAGSTIIFNLLQRMMQVVTMPAGGSPVVLVSM